MSGTSKPFNFVQALIFQWVNPKAWVMILSGVGVFATPENISTTTGVLALSFFVAIFPCNGAWLFLGSSMQKILKTNRHFQWFNRLMAVLLLIAVLPSVFKL